MFEQKISSANRDLLSADRASHGNRPSSISPGAIAGIRLSALRNNLDWRSQDLAPGSYTLGSGNDSDLVINVEGVAARHCTLIIGSQRTVIKAWSPRTWINDGAISEGTLKIGDRLILGPVEFLISALPVTSGASQPNFETASEDDLQLLLASARKSTQNEEFDDLQKRRRETQLNELLAEVQASLDQLLKREHATREEFSKERMVLRHRAQELDQQWALVEQTRNRLSVERTASTITPEFVKNVKDQHEELGRLESLLNERHEELAGRARQLVSVHRRLRTWDNELRSRQIAQSLMPENSQMAALRANFARNEAQERHLTARQNEISQREEAYQLQIEEITANRFQVMEQTRQLEEEQRQWNSKCRSRERFLDELETSLHERMQDLTDEEERLSALQQRVSEQELALTDRIVQLESGQEAIDHTSHVLEQQKRQQTEESARLTKERDALDSVLEKLQADRSELNAREAQFEILRQQYDSEQGERSGHAEEFQQRDASLHEQAEELDRQRQELTALRSELTQRQAKLENLETTLALRQSVFLQREDGLVALEQRLESIRSELAQQADEIESAKVSLQAQANQSPLATSHQEEALSAAQAELAAERQQLAARLAEAEAERAELTEGRDQLQIELNDITAERQNFVRLRGEIEAERQRDAYDREQLQSTRLQLDSLQAELERQRLMQADELAEIERQRAELKFIQPAEHAVVQPQEHLEAERQSLDEQLQHLQASEQALAEDRDALERQQQGIKAAGLKLKEEQEHLQSLEAELAVEQKHLAARERDLEEGRLQLQAEHDQLRAERELLATDREEMEARFAERSTSRPEALEDRPAPLESHSHPEVTSEKQEELAAQDSPGPVEEDEAAVKLRLQLATLFGMSPAKESGPREAQKAPAEPPRSRRTREAAPPAPVEPAPIPERTPVPETPRQVSEPKSEISEEGDDSVAAYMERLLARTRQPGQVESRAAVQAPPPPKPKPEAVRPPEDLPEVEAEPVKKVRKLDDGEKKSMRANLHSFREVANQSARTAVAKSKCTQKSSLLKSMTILNVIGWLVAITLATSELWLGKPLLIEAAAVCGVSLVLTLLCIYRYKEIRKLTKRTAPAAEKLPAGATSTDPAQTEDPPAKSGPLSFL